MPDTQRPIMSDKLATYLKLWDVSDPQLLAQTVTSDVFTVTRNTDRVILKLLTEYGWEEQHGGVAMRYFGGRGAVQLYEADEHAQLMEYAAGDDLIGMVKRGDDEQATRIIADVLNQLHSAPIPAIHDDLIDLGKWFRALFAKADADTSARVDSVYVRGAAVARALLDAPLDQRVLHGDMHHGNVRHAARGWLAYDAKGIFGERAYDAANTLCNPFETQEVVLNEARLLKNAAILAETMHIPLDRILRYTFAYVCLSASWWLGDGVHPAYELRIAQIIEPHLK